MRRRDDFTIKQIAYGLARNSIKSVDGFDYETALGAMEIIDLTTAPDNEKAAAQEVLAALEALGKVDRRTDEAEWNRLKKLVVKAFDYKFDLAFDHNLNFEEWYRTRFGVAAPSDEASPHDRDIRH